MALRGDLADASPAALLASLSEQHASGALAIEKAVRSAGGDGSGETAATLHLRNGLVYAAALAGGTFLVGTRLVTSHALDADALAEGLEAQRSDLSGWRLGEILVHLGHIHADVVEKISIEQVLEIATEVMGWRSGSWKFRSGERTRAMLPHPMPVDELLARVQARGAEWRDLLPTVGGRDAPLLRTSATVPLNSSRELMALLRASDEHTGGLEACSHAAGVSLLEGARLVVSARAAGLLIAPPVEERIAVGDWPPAGVRGQTPSAGTPATSLALAPALAEPAADEPLTSYALARLLELAGPVRMVAPEAAEPVVTPAAAEAELPEPVVAEPVVAEPVVPEPVVHEPAVPDQVVPEPTPEEIVADLEPEAFEDTGHEATVLDLNAARAARSAELAAIEEAATSAALREQLAREQADRDADERAVADALRLAVQSRLSPATVRETPPAPPAETPVPPAVADAPATPAEPELPAAPEPAGVPVETLPAEPEPAFTRPAAFSTAPFAAAPAAFTKPATAPVPLTAGERLGMFSTSRDPLADTASLLRELSSLGDEDDDPAENRPLSHAEVAHHAPAAAHKAPDKKRKGLFGR